MYKKILSFGEDDFHGYHSDMCFALFKTVATCQKTDIVGALGETSLIRLAAILISILIGFENSNQAFAFYFTPEQRCSTIDLRNDFSLQMRNQGDLSWCYAHASADYLQYIHRIPVQISAADIATHYNQRRWPRLVRWLIGGRVPETGFARSAMYDIYEIGYCPETHFPSEVWTKRILNGAQAGTVQTVSIKTGIEELHRLAEGVSQGFYRNASDFPYAFEFQGMTQQEFIEAVMVNPENVLNEVRSAACDRYRIPFAMVPNEIQMEFKGKNTFAQINRVLERRQPLTIDFFYGFLENANDYAYSISDLHTTLLMGRRYDANTGECQYLIKNSYGTSCQEYDRRHHCENGYVWVNELSLYGAMTSFVYAGSMQDQFNGTGQQNQDVR